MAVWNFPPRPATRTALLLVSHALLAGLVYGQAISSHYAVIISSSRYWLNYRHVTNALGVYQAIRK